MKAIWKERVEDWGKTRIKQRAESALVTGTERLELLRMLRDGVRC
jgi:hypothetical protein